MNRLYLIQSLLFTLWRLKMMSTRIENTSVVAQLAQINYDYELFLKELHKFMERFDLTEDSELVENLKRTYKDKSISKLTLNGTNEIVSYNEESSPVHIRVKRATATPYLA